MKGIVEIYSGDKLVYQDDNLVVDGAGQTIVDMLTTSPSLSGIASASALLDTSNYTIQAISFGTASKAYQVNAHAFSEGKATLLSATHADSALGVVIQSGGNTVSSYSPIPNLSNSPNPVMQLLELTSDVSAQVSGLYLSSIVGGNGQNLNVIPIDYHRNLFSPTVLSSLSSVGASILGCWPEASGYGGTNFSSFSGPGFTAADVGYSGTYNSLFNAASSMDTSGFVNMVMSGSPNTTTDYLMSSLASGLCVSGGHEPTNSGIVEYSIIIGSGDVGYSNLYGGIYTLGIWTIDMDETLKAGNTPPYSFGPLNNPRKYKLFATKHLTKNLGYIVDDGTNPGALNYTDLTIKWRLHFL